MPVGLLEGQGSGLRSHLWDLCQVMDSLEKAYARSFREKRHVEGLEAKLVREGIFEVIDNATDGINIYDYRTCVAGADQDGEC